MKQNNSFKRIKKKGFIFGLSFVKKKGFIFGLSFGQQKNNNFECYLYVSIQKVKTTTFVAIYQDLQSSFPEARTCIAY